MLERKTTYSRFPARYEYMVRAVGPWSMFVKCVILTAVQFICLRTLCIQVSAAPDTWLNRGSGSSKTKMRYHLLKLPKTACALERLSSDWQADPISCPCSVQHDLRTKLLMLESLDIRASSMRSMTLPSLMC